MAQWLGQFSGLTHATRVEGAENALRAAVESFNTAPPEDSAVRIKAVRKLAEQRVLRARLQFLKAGLAAAQRIPTAEALEKRARQIEHLRAAHEAALEGGVDAIITEFGVSERRRHTR